MRLTWRMTLAAGALMLGAVLPLGATSAQAQAVGGGAYRGNFPGYYYSPGGYSGGYYFSPGYYPNPAPAPTAVRVSPAPARSTPVGTAGSTFARGYYGMSAGTGVSRATVYRPDPAGRTNTPVPLAKPWLRPLR